MLVTVEIEINLADRWRIATWWSSETDGRPATKDECEWILALPVLHLLDRLYCEEGGQLPGWVPGTARATRHA